MPSPKILCISFDRVVSESRCSSLKEAGYDVTARTNVKEGLELLNRDRFDAVIVGHRFSAEEKYLLAAAREKANTPVILVCGRHSRLGDPCDQPSICTRGQHRSSVSVVAIVPR